MIIPWLRVINELLHFSEVGSISMTHIMTTRQSCFLMIVEMKSISRSLKGSLVSRRFVKNHRCFPEAKKIWPTKKSCYESCLKYIRFGEATHFIHLKWFLDLFRPLRSNPFTYRFFWSPPSFGLPPKLPPGWSRCCIRLSRWLEMASKTHGGHPAMSIKIVYWRIACCCIVVYS